MKEICEALFCFWLKCFKFGTKKAQVEYTKMLPKVHERKKKKTEFFAPLEKNTSTLKFKETDEPTRNLAIEEEEIIFPTKYLNSFESDFNFKFDFTKKNIINFIENEINENRKYTFLVIKDGFELFIKESGGIFSSEFPDYLFFQRKGKIRYIKFPPETISMDVTEDKSEELASYNISISEYKLKKDAFVFSADVYFDCDTIDCSAEKIKQETSEYQTYTNLHMFHWDQWLIEGKGSHLFYQKFKLNGNKFELIDTPRDLTLGMELNTPPLFTSNENYDLSPDGNLVAFSVHERNHEESWSTSWHTYFIEPSMMDKPFMITKHTEARTQNPKFSLDNTRIAYLAMKTPMLESENLHFEIYNILTGKVSIIDDLLDLSVTDYFWENDHLLYFSSTVLGLNKIFTVDIADTTKPVFKLIDTKSTTASFGLPIKALKNRNIKK